MGGKRGELKEWCEKEEEKKEGRHALGKINVYTITYTYLTSDNNGRWRKRQRDRKRANEWMGERSYVIGSIMFMEILRQLYSNVCLGGMQ